MIKRDSESLIIENPGHIRVGKYQMRLGGESDPRNKALMKMFNLIDIGERARSGVPELFLVWEQQGWEEPVIEERYGEAARTVLTLSLKKKNSETDVSTKRETDEIPESIKIQLSPAEISVLAVIIENPGCSYASIAEKLSIGRTAVSTRVKKLKEKGIIERSGSNKDGFWKIKY